MGNFLRGQGSYPYTVAPYGFYQTIQSAIDAVIADSETPATVFISPGTYTEDLTLYENVNLTGSSEGNVYIQGVHTPPTSGSVNFSNIWFYSSTDVLNDTTNAGSTYFKFNNCGFSLDNGYIFNLPDWVGSLFIDSCIFDVSTANGIIYNTGGADLSILRSIIGTGSTTATLSGTHRIKNSIIGCPLTFVSTATADIEECSLNGLVTIQDDANVSIAHSRLISADDQTVLTVSSSEVAYLENIVVETSVVGSAIDGSGTIEATEVTFRGTDIIAGTLTINHTGNVKVSNLATHGVIDLPNTIATGLEGVIRFDTDNFIHKMGTRNTFVGRECGYIDLTTTDAVDNSGFGNESLHDLTTGESNTSVGSYSQSYVTSGSFNSSLGALSLNATAGSYNLALGYQAGSLYTSNESSNILLGNTGVASDTNVIRIGTDGTSDGQQSDNYQAGIYQTTVGAAAPNREVVWIDNTHKMFSTNGGLTIWMVATGSLTMATNTGYIIKHDTPATLAVLTLPVTSAIGDVIEITGYTSGMFEIAQNDGQQIFFGNQSTTVGTGGSIEATHRYDSIKLVCCTDDTEWKVLSSVGIFNVI